MHRLLVETAAPRLVDRRGMAEHGATALNILLDYLDETDCRANVSDRVARALPSS